MSAASPRPSAASAALALLLLFPLLLPHALASSEPQVLASTYRVDLGLVAPGETREGTLGLSNPGLFPVVVRLVPEPGARHVGLPESVELGAGEAKRVPYRYQVPLDATPGHHGEGVRIVLAETEGVRGRGTLAAGTAILFTSRVAALGVSSLEAPPLRLPGEPVAGRALVVNTWNESVVVAVRLEWRAPDGALVATRELAPAEVRPGGFAAFPYRFEDVAATPGVQTLRASVVPLEPADAPASTRDMEHTFLLGIRASTVRVLEVRDVRDGNATVEVEVVNTGTVPTTVRPRVVATGAETFQVALEPVALEPGERRVVTAILSLPPGRYAITAYDEADPPLSLASLELGAATFEMRAPASALRWSPWWIALGLAGAALVALAVVAPRLLAPRVRAWRARPRRAEKPPLDGLEALLARLEREEALERVSVRFAPDGRVAVLMDLASLGIVVDPAALAASVAAGRTLVQAVAYAPVQGGQEARVVERELAAAGFAPRAREQPDFRVDIALDATEEARRGRVVVLCTHDAAFAELARRLRAAGASVEVAGVGSRTPGALRDQADHFHDLARVGRGAPARAHSP